MNKQRVLLILWLMLLLGFTNFVSAQKTVTGKVTTNTGEEIPGATIRVKGTSTGTITDLDGKYSISVASEADILVFSFIGMETVEKAAVGSVIDCILDEDTEELEEVIVVGYGVMKKSDKTGAVANITSDELNKGVVTDPIQALQGKAAGVVISKAGGDPNGGFSVKIRNASGITSGSTPLYVVDGVPGVDPTTISPGDIESFNVLKDASSTAIYGSRGANGVIIITTKRGNTGFSSIEYSSIISIDEVAKRLDLLTATELRNYVAANQEIQFQDGGADTDWQDVIFRTGITQTHNFAVSGGKDKTSFRSSLSHENFMGVIKGSAKQRTIGRINLTQSALQDRLTLQTNIAGTFEHNDYISYSGNGPNDILYQAYQRNPTDPVYNEDGSFYETKDRGFQYYNPLALIEQLQDERLAKRFFGNMKADLEIIDGLVLGANFAYIRDDEERFKFEPSFAKNEETAGYGERSYSNTETKLLETTITYTKDINKTHNINFVGGYSFQEDIYDGLGAKGTDPLSDFTLSHNLGVLNKVNPLDIWSWKSSNRLISFFGRASYNLGSKYYITATVRRDGSSKFGKNNEWGIFPSASLAWNLKNEAFLEDMDFFSMLKLRVGYGLSGNQEIPAYLDVLYVRPTGTALNPIDGTDAILFETSHNANPDLKWEENAEINVGLDFGIFGNKVSGSVEYYSKTTYDLLAEYSVPVPPNPVSSIFANVGEIRNQGIELTLQYYVVDNKKISWQTNLTFTKNKQDVISLSNEDYAWSPMKVGYLSGRGLVGDQNWAQIVAPEYEIGTFYMPEHAGISEDGKFLYFTAAGGVTRDISKAERRVVGKAQPDFVAGWSNYFTFFKVIDLSMSLRSVYGYDILNVTKLVLGNPSWIPTINSLSDALDAKEEGIDDSPVPTSYYLEDGSFLRFDNISLGYTINIKDVDWISSVRLSFNSNNLYTFTNYSGVDPELNYNGLSFGLDQYNVYPKTRTYTFGLNVKF